MNFADLQNILAARTGAVEWNGTTITLRGLSAAEVVAMGAAEGAVAYAEAMQTAVARCMLNGTGPLIPSEQCRDIGAQLPPDLVHAAWQKIAELSGLHEGDSQEIEQGFESGQRSTS